MSEASQSLAGDVGFEACGIGDEQGFIDFLRVVILAEVFVVDRALGDVCGGGKRTFGLCGDEFAIGLKGLWIAFLVGVNLGLMVEQAIREKGLRMGAMEGFKSV